MSQYQIIFGMIFFIIILIFYIKSLLNEIRELKFSKQSQSVKYGKSSEQFFPFLKKFNHPTNTFNFLGMPIDGIAFDLEKGIFFIEFKTGSSNLSEKQRAIKKLIENNKVYFEEIKI